jgi:hypothetical protein
MERSDMTTTLANQLARINLATSGSMQSAQVVTLEIGAQDRFLGSRKIANSLIDSDYYPEVGMATGIQCDTVGLGSNEAR